MPSGWGYPDGPEPPSRAPVSAVEHQRRFDIRREDPRALRDHLDLGGQPKGRLGLGEVRAGPRVHASAHVVRLEVRAEYGDADPRALARQSRDGPDRVLAGDVEVQQHEVGPAVFDNL